MSPEPPDPRRPHPLRRGRQLGEHVALAEALGYVPSQAPIGSGRRSGRELRVRAWAIRRARWDAVADADSTGAVGFIVLDGTLIRQVRVGHREGGQLVGPGDFIQPGHATEADVSWRAITDVKLAIIDHNTLVEAANTAGVTSALLASAIGGASTIARQLIRVQWSSMDDRILATFAELADRWGVVTPEGYALPAFLTHAIIAPLVGARRPSVTTALQRLKATGDLRRADDDRWILKRACATQPQPP